MSRLVKAYKEHGCVFCPEPIKRGDVYSMWKGWDRGPVIGRAHQTCDELATADYLAGRVDDYDDATGAEWTDWIEDYPGMTWPDVLALCDRRRVAKATIAAFADIDPKDLDDETLRAYWAEANNALLDAQREARRRGIEL